MSVGIPSSNPAYSLESVLQSQLEVFTQPNPQPVPAGASDSTAKPTYNKLPGSAADLATSTTASTLTQGGSISLRPYKGSAAQLVFTNDTTGEKSVIGTVSAGLTTNVNGSNVTSGNVSTNDVGVYAAHQNAPTPLPGTADASISVQSGATQGSSTDTQGVSQAILQGANDDAGHLSGLISQYA